GLQTKTLVVFLLLALTMGLLTVGPRLVFRSRWPWLAALVTVAVWAPNLWWQATNGWPQLELSRAIASGRSGTSEPRWLFLPYQLVLISPVLVPVWVAGWWRLARSRQMAIWRAIPAAYVVLALVFIASGGKPYYLCGLYPALLAAGAEPVLAWTGRGWLRVRSVFLGAALVMSLAISMVLFLPVVPVGRLAGTPVVDINYDAGETVGWPALAATIATSYDALPRDEQLHAIVLTSNYGEAGAVMRFRPEVGPVFSGQNSLYDLGPPPADTETVIAVGYDETDLRAWFARVRQEAQVDNGVDVDNDEQGTRVWVCGDPRLPWTVLWSQLRRLG
nr:hypothetical protein [Propionibacteriales bacterium]